MTANTWRYVTASSPGQPANVYEGSADSENLQLLPTAARDLPKTSSLRLANSTRSLSPHHRSSRLNGAQRWTDPRTVHLCARLPRLILAHLTGKGCWRRLPDGHEPGGAATLLAHERRAKRRLQRVVRRVLFFTYLVQYHDALDCCSSWPPMAVRIWRPSFHSYTFILRFGITTTTHTRAWKVCYQTR